MANTLDATLPDLELYGLMGATLIEDLPDLQISAFLTRAKKRMALGLNLKCNALSQYSGYHFDSMCVFNGQPIAVSEDGLFTLGDAETFNGKPIEAIAELVTTNFGMLSAKRMRKVYVGYEASGDIVLKVQTDDNEEKPYTLEAFQTGQKQHRSWIPMSRSMKGVYWRYRIENTDGCDFSIDIIESLPIILGRGR